MSLREFTLNTEREGLYNITAQVNSAVAESGISDGLCVIYCPHTTAGITINENADPDVIRDLLLGLREAFPDRAGFRHIEGNSSAHLKTSSVGASQTVIVEDGRLRLGRWQGIYFCEFDGPRKRSYIIKIIQDV